MSSPSRSLTPCVVASQLLSFSWSLVDPPTARLRVRTPVAVPPAWSRRMRPVGAAANTDVSTICRPGRPRVSAGASPVSRPGHAQTICVASPRAVERARVPGQKHSTGTPGCKWRSHRSWRHRGCTCRSRCTTSWSPAPSVWYQRLPRAGSPRGAGRDQARPFALSPLKRRHSTVPTPGAAARWRDLACVPPRRVESVSTGTDSGTAGPARVGLLSLDEDRFAASEIRAFLVGGGVEVLDTRVGMPASLTLDGFLDMDAAFQGGAALLADRCSLMAVACASVSVAMGPALLTEIVGEGLRGAEVIEPIAAYVDSLTNRSASRVALLTPYAAGTHRALSLLLQEKGITVVADVRLRVPGRQVPSDVAPMSIIEAVNQADLGNAEALLISCTALSTMDLLDGLESQLGVPVVTTNRALAESITAHFAEG